VKAILVIGLLVALSADKASSGYLGKWLMIDDETGNKKSVINLYKKGEKLFGDIIYLYSKKGRSDNPVCSKCDDDRKGKYWVGMQVIRDMKWSGSSWVGGNILDPLTGNTYSAKFWFSKNNKDVLFVRAYLGPIYRTQSWLRVPAK
jgi:uncharacterized protein (DUF2147 family)